MLVNCDSAIHGGYTARAASADLQLRRAVRQEAPGDPGVRGAEDLVVGVAGEGYALQN